MGTARPVAGSFVGAAVIQRGRDATNVEKKTPLKSQCGTACGLIKRLVWLILVVGLVFERCTRLEPMDATQLQQALDAITRSAQAAEQAALAAAQSAQTAADAQTAAAAQTAGRGDGGVRIDADPRTLRRPNVFHKNSREEEAASWSDWKRGFLLV